jgi:hypothetical protein
MARHFLGDGQGAVYMPHTQDRVGIGPYHDRSPRGEVLRNRPPGEVVYIQRLGLFDFDQSDWRYDPGPRGKEISQAATDDGTGLAKMRRQHLPIDALL